jgi:hypothetical protein
MVAVVLQRAPAGGVDGEQVEELQGARGKRFWGSAQGKRGWRGELGVGWLSSNNGGQRWFLVVRP